MQVPHLIRVLRGVCGGEAVYPPDVQPAGLSLAMVRGFVHYCTDVRSLVGRYGGPCGTGNPSLQGGVKQKECMARHPQTPATFCSPVRPYPASRRLQAAVQTLLYSSVALNSVAQGASKGYLPHLCCSFSRRDDHQRQRRMAAPLVTYQGRSGHPVLFHPVTLPTTLFMAATAWHGCLTCV